ncbi:MAG TPA: CAP domain-containing protein [Polyangiaceae bacterium]|nr:CAP domain-containing protein [Polyangiaceae bacterium]
MAGCALGAIAGVGCSARVASPGERASKHVAPSVADSDADFARVTASPEPTHPSRGDAACGERDGALDRAAARVLETVDRTGAPPEAPDLAWDLRASGSPHPWPHAWSLSAPKLADEDVGGRIARFLGSFAEGGVRRCGLATARAKDGSESIAVVAVDALADLSPLPTRVRSGQWLTVSATLLVPVTAAKLVVLGPSGAPRTVPTTLHGDRASATFAPDRPGTFALQLLATTSEGPRPVLDALVFADRSPERPSDATAPGEAKLATSSDADAIAAMLNGARDVESAPPLSRVDALDRIAVEHARRLASLGRLAHDAGDGTPDARMRRAGIEPARSGENVAHARSAVLAHRLLWASPSHRANVLDGGFDSFGVGVVRGEDATLWVCELFARLR